MIQGYKKGIIIMMIKEILLSLISGVLVGAIFAAIKLPIPAPQTFAGVMGIAGIFLGYLLVKLYIK